MSQQPLLVVVVVVVVIKKQCAPQQTQEIDDGYNLNMHIRIWRTE